MRLAMLLEEKMIIPEDIETLNNWGLVDVVNKAGNHLAIGNHVYLEGEEQAFMNWLKPYDAVWCTVPGTSPIMQQFEAVHISI